MKILIITGISYKKPNLSRLISFLRKHFPAAKLILYKKFGGVNNPKRSTLLSYYLISYVAQADLIISYLNGPSPGRTLEQLYAFLFRIPIIGFGRGRILSPFELVGIDKVSRSRKELLKEIRKKESTSAFTRILSYCERKLILILLKIIFLTSIRRKFKNPNQFKTNEIKTY